MPRARESRDRSLHGNVGAPVYDRTVAQVIDFQAWRREHRIEALVAPDDDESLRRLERAIMRLDGLVAKGTSRLGRRVESELLAITGAVTAGLTKEAVERAERLAERLEHPSARTAQ